MGSRILDNGSDATLGDAVERVDVRRTGFPFDQLLVENSAARPGPRRAAQAGRWTAPLARRPSASA